MASAKRKRTYTRSEVLDFITNDSESEGLCNEYDSDMSDESSDDNYSEYTASNQSSRTATPVQLPNQDQTSSDSDSDAISERSGRLVEDGGRGRARGRGRAIGRGRARGRGQAQGVGRGCARGVGRERERGVGRGRARGNVQARCDVGNNRQNIIVDPPAGNGVNYDWQLYDMLDPFTSDWLPNFPGRQGVLVDTSDYLPVDYFKMFFPDQALELIVHETNRYALQFFDQPTDLLRHSRFHNWVDTDVHEIQAYIALQICMGLCQKHELEDYWSEYRLTRLAFSDIMSRNRYELITSFLHFANNGEDRPERDSPEHDHLWKIRPLMNICEPRYIESYMPRCELSIDESIVKFKGRVSFKQYLPCKPYKWGIKQYALCESKTGYALKFLTYTGKGSIVPDNGFTITESLCLSLLEGFENRGHKVFTDNFYTSPSLLSELQNRQIGASGTVKAGRKGMPADLHPNRLHLSKGDDPVFMRSDNMVACAWHDTKRVHFLSTTETNNTIDKRIRQRGGVGGYRNIEKPVVAEIYNQHMGGVDILDQKLGTFAYPHKSSKWYNTIYHRLREVALVNGYILYCQNNRNKVSPKVFREKVIDGLLEGYERKNKRQGRPSVDVPSRLTERHFVGKYDNPKYKPDCVVCSSRTIPGWKRHQTNFKCKECDLPMCFMPCHEIFHTQKNFQQAAARIVYNL